MSVTGRGPTIALPGDWRTVFDPPALEDLERAALVDFLPRQRWFAAKSLELARTRLVDWGPLSPGLFLALFDAIFADATEQRYVLPLAIQETESIETSPEGAIALLRHNRRQAWLIDGLRDPRLSRVLLKQIAEQREIPLITGRMESSRTSAFGELAGEAVSSLKSCQGPTSSSNSFLFLGEGLLLKIFRRLQGGINPDLDVGRFLTERTDFTALPKVAGSIGYRRDNQEEEATLAMLQQRLVSERDAWSIALAFAKRFFAEAVVEDLSAEATSRLPSWELARELADPEIAVLAGDSLLTAWDLGEVTAAMHGALASRHDDPRFAPEPMEPMDARMINEDIAREAERAFTALETHRDRPSPRDMRGAAWLLTEGRRRVDQFISARAQFAPTAMKIRIHGDYHLGQVLQTEEGFVVLDFEGEPARVMAERLRKFTPIRDVAGMLRSYHYAAFTVALELGRSDPAELARLLELADIWQRRQGAAFLRGYLERARAARFIPADDSDLALLLESQMLTKALYELAYELNNRPDWAVIPICGLVAILDGPADLIAPGD